MTRFPPNDKVVGKIVNLVSTTSQLADLERQVNNVIMVMFEGLTTVQERHEFAAMLMRLIKNWLPHRATVVDTTVDLDDKWFKKP